MARLETRIIELQTQLKPIKDSQQVTDFNTRIKKKLEKVDEDTERKNFKKLHK